MGKTIYFHAILAGALILSGLMTACQPELPVVSSITIEADGLTTPVNEDLYGLTIEEINHGVDGGLYAELIQNRSFEDGVAPLNCPYDPIQNVLITPNGWSLPFMRADSIPGWRKISGNTLMTLDTKELINDKNKRSLLVSVSYSSESGKGGVIAEGYGGISIRKGKKYDLSFYANGASVQPKEIKIALEDSIASKAISDVYTIEPLPGWRRYHHTFSVDENADNAVLTFSADTSVVFWLDVVSLFPVDTWKSRENGLRPDLAALVDSLAPRFIRFPGGSFVEGYTAGTFPIWKETLGDISERKYFWNIWSYGTTNGMGYHEYLQFCEDLNAEPIYVINSGVTSQGRRPRYEDITAMDKLVEDALAAIAYANAPTDSIWGALRAKNGHTEPFHLKYVEIGSENYGAEYSKRFDLFRKVIKDAYPDITVISSSAITKKNRNEWVDSHYYSGERFFVSSHDRFDVDRYSRRSPAVFIGEFGTTERPLAGTLRAAVCEACFLIGAEQNPDMVRRLAFAPVFGNTAFENQRFPLILFNTFQAVASPSYYLLKVFSHFRGDEVLKTLVETYHKPQAYAGWAGIEMFDNSYEIKDVKMNQTPVTEGTVKSGGWKLDNGTLIPEANRWNYVLFGDSTKYAYEYTATIRRMKGSGQIQFRLRDNGLLGEQSDHVCMAVGLGDCELYQQAGGVKDTLASPVSLPFENNRWYKVRMVCENEFIRCYVDDVLIHEVEMRPLPSLVSIATLDKKKNMIYLKVVNTTQHEEKTALRFEGVSIRNDAELIQIIGDPEARNTFEHPELIIPQTKSISFPLSGPMIYNFPPNSITILKLFID